MPAPFQDRKEAILAQLEIPEGDYADASPKGSVDEGVRQLVAGINALDGFVTTSSCAGRVAVYQDGTGSSSSESADAVSGVVASSAGGKGGGKWLFVSHDPIDLGACADEGALCRVLGLPNEQESWPDGEEEVRGFVHLKFEPLILHILTSSLANAQHALSAAMAAGFRESGISSIVTASERSGSDATPMVAVRTSGLAFDSIVAFVDQRGHIMPMVTEAYLRTLVAVANKRFVVNEQRKERFWQALQSLPLDANGTKASAANGHGSAGWEPTDARRARKRAEGLERQQRLRQQRTSTSEQRNGLHSKKGSEMDQSSIVTDLDDKLPKRSSIVSENARALFDDKEFIYLPP